MRTSNNTTVSIIEPILETTPDISTVSPTSSGAVLNQALKEMNLWKAGCQFLTNEEKFKLITASDSTKRRMYKKLENKMIDIKKRLSEVERNQTHTFTEDTVKNGVHVVGNVSQLQQFMTPVHADKVYFTNGTEMVPAPGHKAIVNKDGKIINVVKNSYNLVRNEDIVMPLLEHLDKLDSKWIVDPTHSFINDRKMRIQLTFPELIFNDGASDIAMSLFINNSYDGSEGIKAMWGAIRGICSNGMVFGKVFARFYAKHTSGFSVDRLKEQMEDTYKLIPTINERVKLLSATEFNQTTEFDTAVSSTFGTRALAYLNKENGESKDKIKDMWALYNVFTYYISHYVNYRTRSQYQTRLAKMLEF